MLGKKKVTLFIQKDFVTFIRFMKIIHTADWHLGNVFHGHRRTEEHAHFFDWLLRQIEEQEPDVLLITGDVFDTANPSAEAERAYYNFLQRATKALPGLNVIITAGNHDSAGRLEAPQALLADKGIFVVGTIRTDEDGEPLIDPLYLPIPLRGEEVANCVVFALPYLRSSDYPAGLSPEEGLAYFFERLHKYHKKSDFRGLPVIVAAHFYANGAQIAAEGRSERIVVGGQECVDPEVIGENVSYAALGHLHRAQTLSDAPLTAYAGSALPMSFSEKYYQHGANLVFIDDEGYSRLERLEYTPLRALVTIPERGAMTGDEALKAVAQLSKMRRGDEATCPYLELRILEDMPRPELMHQLSEELEDKAVRFCCVKRESHAPTGKSAQQKNISIDRLREMDPREMAQRIYHERFGSEMPEALAQRFEQAVSAALATESAEENEE